MNKPIPLGCEAYCCCPACMGPGYDEWRAAGSPTNCTDGKVHLMSVPGWPVKGEDDESVKINNQNLSIGGIYE